MSKVKVGDKVRVSRAENEGWSHGIKFGAVCTVAELLPREGEVLVFGPLIDDSWNLYQTVSDQSIKLAKQANRKGSFAMTARTFNGGFVAMGGELSITNGVTREVRAMILEREARDANRRKAYRKKPAARIGSANDTFKEYRP